MQNSGGPSEKISSNAGILQSGSMYCSTSTLSDTGSWDTDFDDDQNSESSGFYGDVVPTLAPVPEKPPDLAKQSKVAGQGRVAALAKTVAASLAASGHSGSTKFQRPGLKNETTPLNVHNGDSTGNRFSSRPSDRPPIKPLAKPLVSTHCASSAQNISTISHQRSSNNNKVTSKESKQFSVNKSNVGGSTNSIGSLPKPPGPGSEQVQQVIGALGNLWSSDSISLSSQTQSDDDYEPMQSDSSPQMARLSPHPLVNGMQSVPQDDSGNCYPHPNENYSSKPDSHASAVVSSFLHSSLRGTREQSGGTLTNSAHPKTSLQASPQSSPFLHSSAAAAALAAASRLSHCSKRSSGSDSVYSPSSGSSVSEISHLQNQQNYDGVYEPIEEKQKVQKPVLRSYLHSSLNSEKIDGKRPSTAVKNPHQDQRPPVPNRPLPPTPTPAPEKIAAETGRGGSLGASLEHHSWFHNVDRKRAEELIKNGVDGYFLIRPSSQSQNPLTLTLWYNHRVYNISVRRRKDGRIALGFEKPDEQSFSSIEEMVNNYYSENLLLFSRNERTGCTVLTKSPPK